VNDRTRLIKPTGKPGEFEEIWYEQVKEKFGGTPLQVIDVLALIGDKVDNVPGAKGIGEKTAIPLVQKYGSVEGIYEHIDEIESNSVRQKLLNSKADVLQSKILVTISLDVPIETDPRVYIINQPDFDSLDKLFTSLGFNTLRSKWKSKAIASIGKENVVNLPKTEVEELEQLGNAENSSHDYNLINTEQLLNQIIDELSRCKLVAFDLETSSLDTMSCEITGIALCGEENRAFYIPVDEGTASEAADIDSSRQGELFSINPKIIQKEEVREGYLPVKSVLNQLKGILENPAIGKCGQNSKFDMSILSRYGIDVYPLEFDSMIASYLLNPDEKHNLDALSEKWLNYRPIPISSLIGEKKSAQISMKDVAPEKISDYACEDADLALKLRNILYEELENSGLLKLAVDIEFPVVSVLTRMEINGVSINEEALQDISLLIEKQLEILKKSIYSEAGQEFNIDSPKQLGTILFDKMMIPPTKEGKTGYSTDVQVLTALAPIYPIAEMMLEYRQLTKLKSTYIDTLPKLVNKKTGRIHTTYNQTIASTGRLSSTDPNLQNIPIRTDLGKEIRRAFVPQYENLLLLSADYSQVELRIMAHICQDDHLIDAFANGLDIHAATAAILFDKKLDEVNSDMRRVAKTVNFGIMYGLGSFGLSQRLGLTRSESKSIIDNYFRKYPGIRRYIDETIENTQKTGYTETLCGRRRHFPDINSKNRTLRQAAERAAINMPIQGTASDMMKIAMINIDKAMIDAKFKSKMILQVHDELVFESYPEELTELLPLVKKLMENALPLGRVPVLVETGTGKNWFEAH
jgi:DNA polymerase-1